MARLAKIFGFIFEIYGIVRLAWLLYNYYNLFDYGIVFSRVDGSTFIEANRVFLRQTGYSIEELRKIDYLDLVHPDDQARTTKKADAMAAGDVAKGFTNRYRTNDGRYITLEWHSQTFNGWFVSRVVFKETKG